MGKKRRQGEPDEAGLSRTVVSKQLFKMLVFHVRTHAVHADFVHVPSDFVVVKLNGHKQFDMCGVCWSPV